MDAWDENEVRPLSMEIQGHLEGVGGDDHLGLGAQPLRKSQQSLIGGAPENGISRRPFRRKQKDILIKSGNIASKSHHQ
ncbi:MAG: hypothetical protein MUC41_18710, partial [Syntrophobacteraceae bacterium]|nr:hypothetical protein [Syntrophobacteraceae bacterium]